MNLLENGFDSLKSCVMKLKTVSTIAPTNPSYEFLLKDITISLHHSTEAIFKHLVQCHNPYLIYADINKYFEQEIQKLWNQSAKQSANNSIQFLDAIHCAVVAHSIHIERDTYIKIKKLNDTRNELTHYTYSFVPQETENYIALLLPELYKIYNAHIPEFDLYAKENGLYSNIKELTEEAEIWGLSHAINLLKRWQMAASKIAELLAAPTKIKQIYDNKKPNAIYFECPCCHKEMLYITSNYITGATNTRYLGTCEYCGLQINEEDGKLFSMILDNDTQITEEELTRTIIKFLSSVLLITRYDKADNISRVIEENKDALSSFMDNNAEEIAVGAKIKYKYLLDDICTQAALAYFEKNIYFKNDIIESHYIDDDTTIELDFEEVCEDITISEENENIFERFKLVSRRFSSLSPKAFRRLFSLLKTNYISFHTGMFMEHDGVERDVEFTIQINVSDSNLKNVKNFL